MASRFSINARSSRWLQAESLNRYLRQIRYRSGFIRVSKNIITEYTIGVVLIIILKSDFIIKQRNQIPKQGELSTKI